jgi:hypothetical protein
LDEDEIAQKLADIESGEVDYEDVFNDSMDNDIDIDWEFQYDDCWTDRKGGYEVTYELDGESSWVEADKDPEPTHKCTKCKWKGQSYDADWQWEDDAGNAFDEARHVCPMCGSDLKLTEHGVVEEKAKNKRMAEIDAMLAETDDDVSDEEALTALVEAADEEDDSLKEYYSYMGPHP